jgi:hypothetical protein
MDNVVVSNATFVKPHFIAELGCDGLTSQEIADSIGMRHDNLVTLVDRLVSSGDFSIPKTQEWSDSNGVKRVRKVFGTDDAKFVVTQSSTQAGRGYCRFLIECESVVYKIAANPFAVMDGMNSDQVALFLESVKAKEAAQRDAQLAKTQLTITSAEKDRAVVVAINSTKEVALLTAKDDVWFTLTVGCKILGLKPKIALAHLRTIGLLIKDNMPSSRLLKADVEVVRAVATYADAYAVRYQPRISPKGLLWLAKHVKFPAEACERSCKIDWPEDKLIAEFLKQQKNYVADGTVLGRVCSK